MFKSVGYIPKSGIAHHMVILSLTFYVVLCLYYGYGKNMKFLAQGTVTVSSTSSYSVKYQTFDGSSITVSRLGKGQYRIYMSSSWNMSGYYQVFLSGIYSTVENTPIYATLKTLYSYYFDVYTADDASTNDGSFSFLVVSTGDWK